MTRTCNGSDINLLMIVDAATGERMRDGLDGIKKPCDCGLQFDDAKRRVVWPHDHLDSVMVL